MPSSQAPIAVVFGTRPEAIKLAPVVLALRGSATPHAVITTGQHDALVREVLDLFGIEPDVACGPLRAGHTLDELLAKAMERVGVAFDGLRPSCVVVQGDTTSMLGSALAAFHRRIPVAHVEAGLRSRDLDLPFPEEMNRRAAATFATWHFAPTERAVANLRADGVAEGIHLVGNTVVDAVRHIVDGRSEPLPAPIAAFLGESPYVLATAHRRESWDGGIAAIANGLRDVLHDLPDHRLVFVTHPNPVARRPVDEAFATEERALVVDALPYPVFLGLLRGARIAISDSGGVQEEGPTLGVPVLVTRRLTERPEGVEAGAVRVVGTDAAAVRDSALELLAAPDRLAAMARAGGALYGDGRSAPRIVRILTGA